MSDWGSNPWSSALWFRWAGPSQIIQEVPWFPLGKHVKTTRKSPWCPRRCAESVYQRWGIVLKPFSIFQHFDVGFDTAIPLPSKCLEVKPLGSTITISIILYIIYMSILLGISRIYISLYIYYIYIIWVWHGLTMFTDGETWPWRDLFGRPSTSPACDCQLAKHPRHGVTRPTPRCRWFRWFRETAEATGLYWVIWLDIYMGYTWVILGYI